MNPGDATTYAAWLAAVQAAGGRRTNMPHAVASGGAGAVDLFNPFTWGALFTSGATVNSVAAAYPASVWVSKVNALEWPQPDDYSADGQTAYYRAPDAVQADAIRIAAPTPTEIAKGAKELSDKWYGELEAMLGKVGAAIALAIILAAVAYGITERVGRKS